MNCAMNRMHAYVGPRGWAVLTLAGGAALASPFLRPPQLDSARFEAPSATAPNFAGAHLSFPALDASPNSTQHLPTRVVSGALPTTLSKLDEFADASTPALPDWVKPRSPLDELIARSSTPATAAALESAALESTATDAGLPTAGSPLASSPRQAHVELQPLRPWRGSGLPASGLAASDLVSGGPVEPMVPPVAEDRAQAARWPLAYHNSSPWQTESSGSGNPTDAHRVAQEGPRRRGPAEWPEQRWPEQRWPDQTLGYVAADSIRAEHVATGVQRPVAAPIVSSAMGSPAAASIGATLSRSNVPRTQPQATQLRGSDSHVSSMQAPFGSATHSTARSTADSAANSEPHGSRFVYQPGLKGP